MNNPTTKLLDQVFHSCFLVAEQHIGQQAAGQLFHDNYRKLLDYFPNLDKFYMDSDFALQFGEKEPVDNDILAFAVWMQQGIRAFQEMMIGLPPLDIRQLTLELAADLESIQFYEYFHQASLLHY